MDLLIEESDDFVRSLDSGKGGMTLVGSGTIDAILKRAGKTPSLVPGGSACNTLVGAARLGARTRMIGKCGRDATGDLYLESLNASGVESFMGRSPSATGRVLSIVTPDKERTMFTHLGASAELEPGDLTPAQLDGVGIFHIEGYLAHNEPVAERAIALAKAAGAAVSLDLASFEVVQAKLDRLKKWVDGGVDIVLANEDEARAFTGLGPEKALDQLAATVPLAVVKLGENGALAQRGGERVRVPARRVRVVDTTGAGDLWASGFLYGILRGLGLQASAELGAAVAAEVVQDLGAAIGGEGWARIRATRDKLEAQAGPGSA